MKKLFAVVVLALACACSSPTMFGGKVTSDYVKHYDGGLECAMVDGWLTTSSCVCHVTDKQFSVGSKAFLKAPKIMCKKSLEQ